ncbi:MAG: hypothetical protein M3370_10175 [Actinomycetota bacterium]|nr:hypothetical protein [Actinomycetota bacterium]
MRATVLASLVLALGLGACGGDPDVIDATPETQPTLTIPGGGAGAGALGEESPATTTPDGEPAPEGTTPEGETPEGETPEGETPGVAPEDGTAAEDPAAEFGDFCQQNPGVEGC